LRASSASDRANRKNDQDKEETKLYGRLCSVAHRNSSFGELHLLTVASGRDVFCYHFITSVFVSQDT
jgi:hypothetical protein